MKYLLTFTFVFALCASSTAQIGAKAQQQSKIYGNWFNSDFGYQMTLTLNAEGTGEFDGDPITFTTQANKLIIMQQGVATAYSFTLQGNTLKVSGGDLEKEIAFIRNGASAETVAETKTTADQATLPPADKTINTKLIGTWSAYGETIEFKENGECTYLGKTYLYTTSSNYVTIEAGQTNVMMAFKVNGDKLDLTANNKTLTYVRGKAGASNNGNNKSGNGTVDPGMVGKWCYVNVNRTNSGGSTTDECITLKEDGSYIYYSERSMSANTSTFSARTNSQDGDQGTWSASADRIYFNSTTKGQTSYELRKMNHPKNDDPMIVVGGRTYVTFFNKAPWK